MRKVYIASYEIHGTHLLLMTLKFYTFDHLDAICNVLFSVLSTVNCIDENILAGRKRKCKLHLMMVLLLV